MVLLSRWVALVMNRAPGFCQLREVITLPDPGCTVHHLGHTAPETRVCRLDQSSDWVTLATATEYETSS